MQRKHGFTLIELLVVVAIIVVLIAILLPSLSKARIQAKDVLCASNMAQVNLAINMYMDEYGKTPYMTAGDGGLHWSPGCGGLINAPAAVSWRPTLIPSFCSSQKVFFCPFMTEQYPSTSNPNSMAESNLAAYVLSLVSVPRSRIESIDARYILPTWALGGSHDRYLTKQNVPIVLEWSSVHKNKMGKAGFIRCLFADGSVRIVENILKGYAPCDWETAPGTYSAVYFRE